MALELRPTTIPGASLILPDQFSDERGYFRETFVKSKYAALGFHDEFVQDSMSFSSRNVIRGLHADPKMAKLVQVLRGAAFDVVVDARLDSPAFGSWQGFELTEGNHHQLYIPAGCLHGFLALTDDVVFCYKQSAEYAPQREIGVRYDDSDIGVRWPLDGAPRVSAKDLANRSFAETFKRA